MDRGEAAGLGEGGLGFLKFVSSRSCWDVCRYQFFAMFSSSACANFVLARFRIRRHEMRIQMAKFSY